MIKVYAERYIHLGRVLQWWMRGPEVDSSEMLSQQHIDEWSRALEDLKDESRKLNLAVCEKLFDRTLRQLDHPTGLPPSYESVSNRALYLHEAFEAELESQCFFFVPAHRVKFMAIFDDNASKETLTDLGEELIHFASAIRAFPEIIFDLEEAGNCFGVGCFTACVFHLMRICELGLVSLGKDLGVDAGISSWEKLLSRIDTKIRDLDSSHTGGWKESKEFYSEAAALMLHVKNAWRNSVSHIRRSYDEHRSRRIFNAVEALMAHLATRLSEEGAPAPPSVLSDPDAIPEVTNGSERALADNARLLTDGS